LTENSSIFSQVGREENICSWKFWKSSISSQQESIKTFKWN